MELDAAFAGLPGLTPRQAQQHMARAVASALDSGTPLLVHAPTGVGKSLGYLVPIATAGRRAIVATATKALQSQLVERDLPLLAEAYGTTFALAMGRGNYACLARDDAWDLVATSGEDCPGQKGCAFHRQCFAERAREAAREVDVVVTNHHLLLLELELRSLSDAPGVMLPESDVIVVDEAHRLASHAADLYGVTVTAARVGRAGAAADASAKAVGRPSDWARRLRTAWEDHAGGLRPGPIVPGSRAAADLARALAPLRARAEEATAALKELGPVGPELEAGVHAARRRLGGLCRDLGRLADPEADGSPAGRPDRARGPAQEADGPVPAGDGARQPAGPAAADEDAGGGRELAVWVEEGRGGGRTVRSALVEPGPVLAELLWGRVPAA